MRTGVLDETDMIEVRAAYACIRVPGGAAALLCVCALWGVLSVVHLWLGARSERSICPWAAAPPSTVVARGVAQGQG